MKDFVYFPGASGANILARHGTRPANNKLRERNRASLFGNARQGRGSLLDNWPLVFALLLILASTHDVTAPHRRVMDLRNNLIRLEFSATKAPDKQDGDLGKKKEEKEKKWNDRDVLSKSGHMRGVDTYPRYQ